MFSDSISSAALEKSMSASWKKAQLIIHNMANEDTPGYKAKRMEFESMLRNELQGWNMRVTAMSKQQQIERVERLQPYVYDDRSTSTRIDGNNVNIDSEEAELARVQLQYQALRDRINGGYNILKTAIGSR